MSNVLTTRPLASQKWMTGLQLSTVVRYSGGQLRTWYCNSNSVLILAAAATVLSGHQNKEEAIAVLKVKLHVALVPYYR